MAWLGVKAGLAGLQEKKRRDQAEAMNMDHSFKSVCHKEEQRNRVMDGGWGSKEGFILR